MTTLTTMSSTSTSSPTMTMTMESFPSLLEKATTKKHHFKTCPSMKFYMKSKREKELSTKSLVAQAFLGLAYFCIPQHCCLAMGVEKGL